MNSNENYNFGLNGLLQDEQRLLHCCLLNIRMIGGGNDSSRRQIAKINAQVSARTKNSLFSALRVAGGKGYR